MPSGDNNKGAGSRILYMFLSLLSGFFVHIFQRPLFFIQFSFWLSITDDKFCFNKILEYINIIPNDFFFYYLLKGSTKGDRLFFFIIYYRLLKVQRPKKRSLCPLERSQIIRYTIDRCFFVFYSENYYLRKYLVP